MAINLQYEPAAQTLGTVAYQAGAGQYRERQGERADANEKFMLQTMLQERARQQNMQQDDRRQQLAMQMQGQQQAFQQAMGQQQFQQQAMLRSSFAMQDPETQSAILRATPDAQAEWNKLLAEEGQLQQAITEGRIRPHQQQQAIAEFQQKKIAFNPSRYTTAYKVGEGPGDYFPRTIDYGDGRGPRQVMHTRDYRGNVIPVPMDDASKLQTTYDNEEKLTRIKTGAAEQVAIAKANEADKKAEQTVIGTLMKTAETENKAREAKAKAAADKAAKEEDELRTRYQKSRDAILAEKKAKTKDVKPGEAPPPEPDASEEEIDERIKREDAYVARRLGKPPAAPQPPPGQPTAPPGDQVVQIQESNTPLHQELKVAVARYNEAIGTPDEQQRFQEYRQLRMAVAREQLPRPASAEEAQALGKGAQFVAPDGTIQRVL
jgi:hypothetical protein